MFNPLKADGAPGLAAEVMRRIKSQETAHLEGQGAGGVFASYIADRDRAGVHNTPVAGAPLARGHLDSKEIVQDRASAVSSESVSCSRRYFVVMRFVRPAAR